MPPCTTCQSHRLSKSQQLRANCATKNQSEVNSRHCKPFACRSTSAKRTAAEGKRAVAAYSSGIPYETLRQREHYELRLYKPRIVVEVPYQRRDEGFAAFEEYIRGGNESGELLEMPIPVIMRYHKDGSKMMEAYIVPIGADVGEGSLLNQPPFPTNAEMSLQIAGGEGIAAAKFAAPATKEACYRQYNQLKERLSDDGIEVEDSDENKGVFRLAQFGPIYSLKAQTYEIWVSVKLSSLDL